MYAAQGTPALDSVKRDLSHLTSSGKGPKPKHACVRSSNLVPRAEATMSEALGLVGVLNRPAVAVSAPDPQAIAASDALSSAAGRQQAAARLIGKMPDLGTSALPASTRERMYARRKWLRHLFVNELERAARAATGGKPSAFEAACGIKADSRLPEEKAAASFSALSAKFEAERIALAHTERLEIDMEQAMGVCPFGDEPAA